jgi:hypothetical protein
VERELAQAGILRMTYEWMLGPAEDLSWNSAVVEVMARKSVEWIQLAMRINDNMASQAPTIVQQWLGGKCRKIQQHHNQDAQEYKTKKKAKLEKAQFTRWRKKVCFDLKFLLVLLISTATHHCYKIQENQSKMAAKIYPQNHQLGAVVNNKDCGLDIEVAENNIGGLPVQMIPNWRALKLTAVLHHFDKMDQA